MRELSIAAKVAWKIAAIEAGDAKHQFIEAEHIFIGICSLGKVLPFSQPKKSYSQNSCNPRLIFIALSTSAILCAGSAPARFSSLSLSMVYICPR